MSNEISVRSSLQIRNGSLDYQSRPTAFNADQSLVGGPTPGEVLVATAGTDIDLTQLNTPGMCRIMNLDSTNYVQYGTWDPDITAFSPLGELLPGETFILRLSRNIGKEFGAGAGTATTGSDIRLRFKANVAACKVLVEAFEK